MLLIMFCGVSSSSGAGIIIVVRRRSSFDTFERDDRNRIEKEEQYDAFPTLRMLWKVIKMHEKEENQKKNNSSNTNNNEGQQQNHSEWHSRKIRSKSSDSEQQESAK